MISVGKFLKTIIIFLVTRYDENGKLTDHYISQDDTDLTCFQLFPFRELDRTINCRHQACDILLIWLTEK